MDGIRKLVSGNRRRFTEDGVNLDLTYITPNIMAMSYPSSGLESMYRNPIEKVGQKIIVLSWLGFIIFERKAFKEILDN
jgi:hypothetical protein